MCCDKLKKYDNREPGLFKEEMRCTDMLCFCSKVYCCYAVTTKKYEFGSKGLNKRVLEPNGDGSLEKYRHILDDSINLRQQTKVSEQTITLLQHKNKLRKDFFLLKKNCRE